MLSLGLILEWIEIVGTNSSIKLEALIDTGAEGNYIRGNAGMKEKIESLGFYSFNETDVSMPRIREPKTYIEYKFLELRFLGQIITFPQFIVMDDIDYDAIIGVEVMQTLGLNIDMSSDKISI